MSDSEDCCDLCVLEISPKIGEGCKTTFGQINPDLIVDLFYHVCSALAKKITGNWSEFLKEVIYDQPKIKIIESFPDAITRAKATPYFIRISFLTGNSPPEDEWMAKITSPGEILENYSVNIIHRDLGGSDDSFFSSESGKVTPSDWSDTFSWLDSVRGVDWLHDWILPCLRKGQDPIKKSNQKAFEAFCKTRNLDGTWDPEEFTYDIHHLINDMLIDFLAFPDTPGEVYEDTELYDLYLAGKVPERYLETGLPDEGSDRRKDWFGYWGYDE